MENKEFSFRLPTEMGSSDENRSISFRISKIMLNDLKELSRSGGLTVTGLIHNVLSDYIKYYNHMKKGNA